MANFRLKGTEKRVNVACGALYILIMCERQSTRPMQGDCRCDNPKARRP